MIEIDKYLKTKKRMDNASKWEDAYGNEKEKEAKKLLKTIIDEAKEQDKKILRKIKKWLKK